MTRTPHLARRAAAMTLTTLTLLLSLSHTAFAQDAKEGEAASAAKTESTEPPKTGWRLNTNLYFRSRPLGTSIFADAGYRMQLFDSESLLLKNTYVEGGAYVGLSPAYIWAGGYAEAVPLAVLKLRAEVQYQNFFGNLGFLYVPPNAANPDEDPEWDVADMQFAQNNDLGTSTTGLLAQLEVTPRVRLGRFVAILENRFVYNTTEVETVYQEPFYDHLIMSNDVFWVTRPTVGGLAINQPGETYLLTALRYERIQNLGQTGVTRDSVGLLALWGIPKSWWSTGNPRFALLGSYVLADPTDRQGSVVISGKLQLTFGAN